MPSNSCIPSIFSSVVTRHLHRLGAIQYFQLPTHWIHWHQVTVMPAHEMASTQRKMDRLGTSAISIGFYVSSLCAMKFISYCVSSGIRQKWCEDGSLIHLAASRKLYQGKTGKKGKMATQNPTANTVTTPR